MRPSPSLAKGVLTGIVAGVAATLVMDQFLKLASAAQKAAERQKKLAQGESPWLIANEQAQQEMKEASEDSTVKLARRIAEAVDLTIPKDCLKAAGNAVHYSFGTLMGVCYSATAEFYPEVTIGRGTAFGTVLFFGADEIAVPAFHLSGPPTETPIANHLQHWVAHIVYGSTLELARNLLRRLI
ncbi:MAG TPA: DUF1440 domain-containing protein [Acidobacteriaceae bacterium]|nr:DUF1440 domain-containing protein [Acidobacteriaceae bacterium]